jgi:hypothetical protein
MPTLALGTGHPIKKLTAPGIQVVKLSIAHVAQSTVAAQRHGTQVAPPCLGLLRERWRSICARK